MKKILVFSSLALASILAGCTVPHGVNSSEDVSSSKEATSSQEVVISSEKSQSSGDLPGKSSEETTSEKSTEVITDHLKVYCETSWENIYAWNSSGTITAAWPGNPLLEYDKDWKYYEFFDYTSLNLIFNKSGKQTADLSRTEAGAYYYYQDAWYDKNPLEDKPVQSSEEESESIESEESHSGEEGSSEPGLRILHCFDWNLSAIENNLNDIKNAGFDAIQTSPLQMPKDYNSSWTGEGDNWWKIYQPLSFSVASTDWIGNPSTLKSLTAKAKNLGIKVIVDVVANHMASGNNNAEPNWNISNYEADIYNNRSQTFREYIKQTDNSTKETVWGNIGIPDLNTSNSIVQNRVCSYLKELIDDGVSGFRFDAAKHIETSNDGDYASDFWENTLQVAQGYASNKNVDLFAYGEILSRCGGNRKFSDYIDYANLDAVTDNDTGNNLRDLIHGNSSS
nr:starch-binding protein [Bacilli bacterium]